MTMATEETINKPSMSPSTENNAPEEVVVKLKPLELNNIKIDLKHTVLTPDYLENIDRLSQK